MARSIPTEPPATPRKILLGHDRRYAIDFAKLQSELGWRPTESFATGLEKTVRWYLDNNAWVADVQSGEYKNWVEKNYGARV